MVQVSSKLQLYSSRRKLFDANDSYYQSLNKHVIKYLQGVQLHTEIHDQGYVTDRAQGNWTWLELAIYENESSDSPRVKEDVKLLWQSHKNSMGSKEFVWVCYYVPRDAVPNTRANMSTNSSLASW